jgi:hypothetical protein
VSYTAILSLIRSPIFFSFVITFSSVSNRHRVRGYPRTPATPPDMRVRIRRFGGVEQYWDDQTGEAKRVEELISQRNFYSLGMRESPRTMNAGGCFRRPHRRDTALMQLCVPL